MRLLLVVAFLVACSDAVLACSGCGCRGGPGYRGPDGRCVGWSQLNSKCGNPPTSRCTYEGSGQVATPPGAPAQGPYVGSTIGMPAQPPAPAPASNVQKTRSSGIGCTSQEAVRRVATCATAQGRDCEQEKAALIEAATCAMIPAGVDVRIEAGSHSFEWLRIRVPGHLTPL